MKYKTAEQTHILHVPKNLNLKPHNHWVTCLIEQ